MLVADGTLFDLPDERLRQNTLPFAAGPYRYFRVTWDDTNSARVPNPTTVEVAAPRLGRARHRRRRRSPQSIERRPSEPGLSRYRVRLPGAALPVVALDLDVGAGTTGGHVYRQRDRQRVAFRGARGSARRTRTARRCPASSRDGLTAAALRIPIAAPSEAELDLTIEDGANEPLDVRGVSVVLAELPWIYFEAPAGARASRATATSGCRRAVYDLEAVRAHDRPRERSPQAKWGDAGRAAPAETAGCERRRRERRGHRSIPSPFRLRASTPPLRAARRRVASSALPLDATSSLTVAGLEPIRRRPGSRHRQPAGAVSRRAAQRAAVDRPDADAGVRRQFERLKTPATAAAALGLHRDTAARGLPAATLVLETSARVFQRTVRLGVGAAAGSRSP